MGRDSVAPSVPANRSHCPPRASGSLDDLLGRSGRAVDQWLAGLADTEIERLSELADREELSKWLLELGAEGQPAPQEHGPE